ncbi:hypothetical protein [Diaminobutyricibacter sp. McL0608]|uniref:hypothetical protein n=1 Tax=Leifsonia sp. McL0608 TaxID=3143537 RepID=UPI0031F2DABE
MARTPKPIVSSTGGTPRGGQTSPVLNRGIDRFLAIQRPVVLSHLRSIRRRNPGAAPAQLATILERRYLAAVTTGGAAVGVTAVVPSIGTGITLALSGLETAGFLEATALYAQSLSELHGIAVDDPDRARALVLTMMLGREGSDLVRQLAGQLGGSGTTRTAYWGELIASSLPRAVVGPLADRLKTVFLRQFAVRGGASIVARAIPFGVGAVVGGAGNNMVGRRVIQNSRLAFGPAPADYVPALDLPPLVIRSRPAVLTTASSGLRRIGGVAGGAAAGAGRMARRALPWPRPDARPETAPEP